MSRKLDIYTASVISQNPPKAIRIILQNYTAVLNSISVEPVFCWVAEHNSTTHFLILFTIHLLLNFKSPARHLIRHHPNQYQKVSTRKKNLYPIKISSQNTFAGCHVYAAKKKEKKTRHKAYFNHQHY